MFTKRDYIMFDMAKAVAKASEHDMYQIGSVLVDGSDILSVGVNMLKSHPIQKRYNRFRKMKGTVCNHFIHSEISTILKVKDKNKLSSGSSLYISRVKKDGGNGLARPCPACYNFIMKETKIRNCYYTTDYGYAYEKF